MAPENSSILSLAESIEQKEDSIIGYHVLRELFKNEFPSVIRKDLKRVGFMLKESRTNNDFGYPYGSDYNLRVLLEPFKEESFRGLGNIYISRLFYEIEGDRFIQLVRIKEKEFSSILPFEGIEELATNLGNNWIGIENVPDFSNGCVSNECIFNALRDMEGKDNRINILRERYLDESFSKEVTDYYLLTEYQLTKEDDSYTHLALSILDNLGRDNTNS